MDTLLKLGEAQLKNQLTQNNETDGLAINSTHSVKGGATPTSVKLNVEATQNKNSKTETIKTYESTMVLDLETFKSLILDIIVTLGIKGITFFYDEWSTLIIENQKKLSNLIRGLSTTPIYHWIAYIPYKSSLGVLEKTADFTNDINLDLNFIYEDKPQVCTNYFTKFINNRMYEEFKSSDFNSSNILRTSVLDLLIKCSMGNTRDFGVILNKAWEYFKIDYLNTGKNQVISKSHLKKAIKDLSEEKQDNLKNSSNSKYAEKLWHELVDFTKSKKHTHFAIELVGKNIDYLNESEMEELLYHRLIHLRKKDYPGKEEGDPRLGIYAIEPSVLYYQIFETTNSVKKIKLVTDASTIHNQTRRYVFNLQKSIDDYRIDQGKSIKCKNPECQKLITEEMTLAWEFKMCTYCRTPFFND
jgi:hypothetical protein